MDEFRIKRDPNLPPSIGLDSYNGNYFAICHFPVNGCCLQRGRDPQTPRIPEKTQTRVIHTAHHRFFHAAARTLCGQLLLTEPIQFLKTIFTGH